MNKIGFGATITEGYCYKRDKAVLPHIDKQLEIAREKVKTLPGKFVFNTDSDVNYVTCLLKKRGFHQRQSFYPEYKNPNEISEWIEKTINSINGKKGIISTLFEKGLKLFTH